MEKLNMVITGTNVLIVGAAGAGGLAAWLGTLTWKLSASLTALSKQVEQTQISLGEFRAEVRSDMGEVRRELTQINTRLSRVEGHVGLAAGAGPQQ